MIDLSNVNHRPPRSAPNSEFFRYYAHCRIRAYEYQSGDELMEGWLEFLLDNYWLIDHTNLSSRGDARDLARSEVDDHIGTLGEGEAIERELRNLPR